MDILRRSFESWSFGNLPDQASTAIDHSSVAQPSAADTSSTVPTLIVGPSSAIAAHDYPLDTDTDPVAICLINAPSRIDLTPHALIRDLLPTHPPCVQTISPPPSQHALVEASQSEDEMNLDLTSITAPPDVVASVIHAFIVAERRRNFAFLAKYNHTYMNGEDLSVYAATDEDITWTCKRWVYNADKRFAYQWYTFRETISGITRTVRIALPPAIGVCTKDMKVLDPQDTSKPVQLEAWLRATYEWRDNWEWKFPQIQHEEMVLWWKLNGKVFRLLDLPAELRNLVYLHIIGPIVLLRLKYRSSPHETRVTLGQGFSYDSPTRLGQKLDPDIMEPNLEILTLNKQIYHEAHAVAWRDTTKRFHAVSPQPFAGHSRRCYDTVWPQLAKIRDVAPSYALRNLQLEFSAACYFELVGICSQPGNPFAAINPSSASFHISLLKNLPALQKLDFRFMSSKYVNAVCPWSGGPSRHSCQKYWIDWFLTFAFDHVKHLSLSVSGCIKNSTRAKWESIFRDSRRGVYPDLELRKKAIRLLKNYDGPIPCFCAIPCNKIDPDLWNRLSLEEQRRIGGLQDEIHGTYFSFAD